MFIVPLVSAIASVGFRDSVVGRRSAEAVPRAWILAARRAAERSAGLKCGSALVVMARWDGVAAADAWVAACAGAAERPAAVTAAIAPIVARRFTYYLQITASTMRSKPGKAQTRPRETPVVRGGAQERCGVNCDKGHDES